MFGYSIETNLTVFCSILEVNAQNHFRVSPYKTIRDEHHHTATITLHQIQADMKDVAFYYRKKNGLRISDTGLADVFLGGKGITVTITVANSGLNSDSIFVVKKVAVNVDVLKFSIHDVSLKMVIRLQFY